MLLLTDDLARRLENAEALDAAGCAEAHCHVFAGSDAASKPIGGGVAVYCGETSPLTHAIGMGMHGPVAPQEMDELEDFFRSRGAPVITDVCPHSDRSFREMLVERGYRVNEFTNVLARTLSLQDEFPPSPKDLATHIAEARDVEVYVNTVVGGFLDRDELSPEEEELGRTLFHMPCTWGYLAFSGDQAAGGGGLSIRNRVASLFGDATLPKFRRQGVHRALILSRMRHAQEAQCDLITAGTLPGSISQRDYQRLGFEVAYTKITMVLE